jgi:HK97 family phage major capsid protein
MPVGTKTKPAPKTPSIQDVWELSKKTAEGLNTVTKGFTDLKERLSKTRADGVPTPGQVFGAPNVRAGENPMSSRGFSFMKMLGLITGATTPDQAKVEMDIHRRLHGVYCKDMQEGYLMGRGRPGETCFLAPLSTSYMQDQAVSSDFRREMKSLVTAGMDGADPDEMRWIRTKQLQQAGYGTKALSWLNELTGGALVAPPEMGELIDLLRNKEALVNAGARPVPLPPQGRMRYPRQTAASTAFWIGENSPITESEIGTGDVTLQAKKLAVLIKAPNELIRFANPAAEALMRDDMTKSLALGLDLAGLEGGGGDNQPLGIINHQNITTITSTTTGANGDTLIGQDIYRFVAGVEEANAEFEGFIMRPKTLYKYFQLRADAVSAADGAGPFLFNLIREGGDGFKPTLAGYPVTKSTQVSQVRIKGSGTDLSYVLGGMWSDVLIGMFGAIEFAATTQGDTAFVNDQTWVRGILSADIQLRHEAAFVFMDNLIVN